MQQTLTLAAGQNLALSSREVPRRLQRP